MFDNLNTDEVVQVEEEKLGGNSKRIEETGVYDFQITKAFGGQSAGGAYFIEVHLKTEDEKDLKVREYITSGKAKNCKNYYVGKDGKKHSLPGYAKMNALDVLLTGNIEQYPKTEKKQIMLYDYEAKKEIPKEADVITSWIGKHVTGLVRMVQEFKQAKNQATGNYEDTAETRTYPEIVHFVDAVTGQTRSEKIAGKDASIKPQFVQKFGSDYVLDKTKGKAKKVEAPAEEVESPFGS
jgi:hypothetical protein